MDGIFLTELAQEKIQQFLVAVPSITYSITDFKADIGGLAIGDVHEWSELFLAQACARGDRVAIRHFHEQYRPRMHRVVAKVVGDNDAEDVYQNVICKLLLGSRPRISMYRGNAPLATWLSVVCANEGLDWLRKVRRHSLLDTLVEEVATTSCELSCDRRLLPRTKQRVRSALYSAIEAFGDNDREILRHTKAGLTTIDTARIMGVHRVTISRRLSHMRNKIYRAVQQTLRCTADDTPVDKVLEHVTLSIDRVLSPAARCAS